jgi:hypothetical protein
MTSGLSQQKAWNTPAVTLLNSNNLQKAAPPNQALTKH